MLRIGLVGHPQLYVSLMAMAFHWLYSDLPFHFSTQVISISANLGPLGGVEKYTEIVRDKKNGL